MTSRPDAGEVAGQKRGPGWLELVRSHPVFVVVTGTVIFLSAAAGLADNGLGLWDRLSGQGSGPAGTPSMGTSAPDTEGTSPTADAADTTPEPTAGPVRIQVGSCLSASLTVVDCGAVHEYEVVADSGQACDTPALLGHLGGRPDVDVVLAEPFSTRVDGHPDGSVCVVGPVDAEPLVGPVADVLATEQDARWRWCHDSSASRDLPCSEPHDVEYVGTAPGSAPDATACRKAAEVYLDASYRRVSDDLLLGVEPVTDRPTRRPPCLLATRRSGLLDDTVRRLGARALPRI